MSLATYKGSFDISGTVDALLDFQDNIVKNPLDMTSIPLFQTAWPSLDVLNRCTKINAIRLRKVRACSMLTNGAAWAWLTSTIPNAIRDIVYQTREVNCFWLSDIMNTIRDAMLNMLEHDIVFHPSRYNIMLEHIHAVNINLEQYRRPNDKDLEGWTRLYSTVIVEILEGWLRYPVAGQSRWQGLYAINIVRTVGPEFLLLDVVWETYRSANHRLMRSSSIPELLDTSRYSLLNPSSALRLNVMQLAQFVNDYMEGRLYRYAQFDSNSGTFIHYTSETIKTISERRIIYFKNFVLDCFRFLFRGEEMKNKGLKGLLINNPDKYSPFREHAPTRKNMRRKSGPYEQPALQTLSGLFSALVCRGVTFGTPFSRAGRTLFHSPEDFMVAVQECQAITSGQLVYCDPAAYSVRAAPKRKPSLVNVYWERVQSHPWEGLTCTAPLPFGSTYEYFRPVSGSRFPELGNLGAYLITVDYVYAGLILQPDADHLGRFICQMNAESGKALHHLGLVSKTASQEEEGSKKQSSSKPLPVDQATLEEYARAFSAADKMAKDSIPREYHAEAGLDVFVTEYILCRFLQAHTLCDLSK